MIQPILNQPYLLILPAILSGILLHDTKIAAQEIAKSFETAQVRTVEKIATPENTENLNRPRKKDKEADNVVQNGVSYETYSVVG